MFSVLGLFLLASCQSISEFVCNTNSSIANQLRWLAIRLRQTLRLVPPEHNRHCRRAAAKSRKRHRLRIAVGSQQAQCLCQRKAPVRQEVARKNTGSRRSEHASLATDTAPTDGADQGSKYPWIVVGNLLFGVVLLAVAHTYMTNLRTTGQSPNTHIIAACNFAQLLAILDPCPGYSKTCAPSQGQSTSANPPSSPASKRNRVQQTRPTSNKGQSRKPKKQNNPVPAIGQSSRDAEDDNGILWACLFHKFDPDTYRTCGGLTLSDWSALFQHITRAHKSPGTYCRTCWTIFGTEGQWDEHIRAQDCESRLGPDEFDDKEMASLAQKIRRKRGATDEEKWFWLWAECFKGHPRPNSPYICSHTQETADLLRRRPGNAPDTGMHDLQHAAQNFPNESFLAVLLAADPSLGSKPMRRHPDVRPDTTIAASTHAPAPQHLLAGVQREQPAAEIPDSSPMSVWQVAEAGSPLYVDPHQLQYQPLSAGQGIADYGMELGVITTSGDYPADEWETMYYFGTLDNPTGIDEEHTTE